MVTFSYETTKFDKELRSNLQTDLSGKYGQIEHSFSKISPSNVSYPAITIFDGGLSEDERFFGEKHYDGTGEILLINKRITIVVRETTTKNNDSAEAIYQSTLIKYLRQKIFESVKTMTFSTVTVVNNPTQEWGKVDHDETYNEWGTEGMIGFELLNTR